MIKNIIKNMNEFNSTDKKIMRATFRILQKEGFAKATTKKIAAEAEVNEVTIFRKFQNKNNLVETTKEYYLQILLKQLEEIFDFNEDDEIDDYFQKNFIELLDRSDKDFRIVKIALEEVREIPDKKQLISRITDTVINKLEDFFKLQIEKGKIRAVDSRVLAGMCFSLTFQSVILWKIYDKSQDVESDQIAREFLDILYNGIKA